MIIVDGQEWVDLLLAYFKQSLLDHSVDQVVSGSSYTIHYTQSRTKETRGQKREEKRRR